MIYRYLCLPDIYGSPEDVHFETQNASLRQLVAQLGQNHQPLQCMQLKITSDERFSVLEVSINMIIQRKIITQAAS